MKAMLIGFVAVVVIAFGAKFTLDSLGFSSAQETLSESNVRLGD